MKICPGVGIGPIGRSHRLLDFSSAGRLGIWNCNFILSSTPFPLPDIKY